MIVKYRVVLIAAVTLISAPAYSQRATRSVVKPESVEKQITRLEQERLNAYIQLDFGTLDRLMSRSYTSIYADGHIVTKAEELASIRSAPSAALSALTAAIDQVSVRQFSSSAVLIGRLTVKGTVVWSEKPININATFRYTAVYIRTGGRWQVVTSHFTKIDQPVE